MIVFSYVPVFFMILGALVYALSANPKVSDMGRMLFLAGAIAFALGINGFGFQIGEARH